MKQSLTIILVLLTMTPRAQTSCSIQRAEAYYYTVIPGTKSVVINIGGEEKPATVPLRSNLIVYLVTNCAQHPVISLSIGKMKPATEFIRVRTNRDVAGKDDSGNLKIIKARKGSYLWKATQSAENEKVFSGKEKIILKGTIGGNKINISVKAVKLAAVPMY